MKNIVKLLIVAVLLATANQSLAAQDGNVAGKLFYTELGGPGVIMSANFDSRFNSNTRYGLGCRIGAGFGYGRVEGQNNFDYVTRTYYSIPVGLNYVFVKPNSASGFEIGAGASFLTRKVALYYLDVEKRGNVIGFISFMYRRMPVNGGFSFRAGFTPIIGTSGDMLPSGAISLGYAF